MSLPSIKYDLKKISEIFIELFDEIIILWIFFVFGVFEILEKLKRIPDFTPDFWMFL